MKAVKMHVLYTSLLEQLQAYDAQLYIAVRLVAECGVSMDTLITLPSKILYSASTDIRLAEPFDSSSIPSQVKRELPKNGYLFGPDCQYIHLKYKLNVFIRTTGFASFSFLDLILYYQYRCLLTGEEKKIAPLLKLSKFRKAHSFGLSLREYIKLLGVNENNYFKPQNNYVGAESTLFSADIAKIWDAILYASILKDEPAYSRSLLFFKKFDASCQKNIGLCAESHDYEHLYKYMDKLTRLAYNGFLDASDIHKLLLETDRLFQVHIPKPLPFSMEKDSISTK